MFWSVLCMPYSFQHLFSDIEKKKKSVASDHTASISYLDDSVSNPHWPSASPSPICIKMLWHKIWTYVMIAVNFYLHIPKIFPDTFFGITFHWHVSMPFLLHAEMCSLINKYGSALQIQVLPQTCENVTFIFISFSDMHLISMCKNKSSELLKKSWILFDIWS